MRRSYNLTGNKMIKNVWTDEKGILSFEWIFVITVLCIGILGGLALLRDAMILEAGETAEAMLKLDTAYTVQTPPEITMTGMRNGGGTLPSATLYGFSVESSVANNNITARQHP